jgi:hypothetical protein
VTFLSIAIPILLVILIIGGLTACFWGYRRFMGGVKSAGFFIGGLLGFLVVFPFSLARHDIVSTLIMLGAGFLIGGIAGFLFSISLNRILTFVTGAIIGFFLSVLVFSPSALELIFSNQFSLTALRQAFGNMIILHIIAAIIVGVLAIFFQRPIVITSTAIWGAAWIVLPLAVGYYWMKHSSQSFKLSIVNETIHAYGVFLLVGWIILSIVGALFQFRYATHKEPQPIRLFKKRK